MLTGRMTLLHGLEGTLRGLVAEFKQTLNRLLAGRMLLAAHNAPLVLHEVALLEAATGVLGGAVKYFCLGADGLLVIQSKKTLEIMMCKKKHKSKNLNQFSF